MEDFQQFYPSKTLAPFIKNYWFLEASCPTACSQRIIPTGYMEMIFHFGDRLFSETAQAFQPTASLSGQKIGYSDLLQTGKTKMLSVCFRAATARLFFKLPMNKLTNKTVSLSDLEDKSLIELEEKIGESKSKEEIIRQLEVFFIQRLKNADFYHYKRMSAVIESIQQGAANLNALADKACLSYRQFSRVFAAQIGSNPKDFIRTLRFQKALYVLQNEPLISLAQLAYACNFYDQSHLIKEFKSFSGYTPGEYLRICQPYSDYFSL